MSVVELSDDIARIDFARVHGWLASSYWSPGISRELVERAARGSHRLGAYADGGQVGYARMITDKATFGWLADVWIDEAARGRGLGRRMVRWFLDHSDYVGVRRFALVTADAHGVYEACGFQTPIRPDRYMERLSAEAEAMLRAAS